MACTWPRCTTMSMSWLATTPGNRLVMPRSSTAAVAVSSDSPVADSVGATMAHAPGTGRSRYDGSTGEHDRPCPPGLTSNWPASSLRSLRGGGNGDLAADDLRLVLFDLCLVRVDGRVRRRVADAPVLQAESLATRLELILGVLLDEVVDGRVDALEGRGQDEALLVGRRGLVLVGVDADGELVLLLGRLEKATARTTGGVVHDVGAVVVLAFGDDLALGRVVEAGEVRRLRDVGGLHLDRRIHGLDAGLVAGLELLDQRLLHPADEADVVRLRRERRGDPDQEGALVLGEQQALEVRPLDAVVVDQREMDLRELRDHLADGGRIGEADRDDRVVPLPRKQGQPVRFGLVALALHGRELLGLDVQGGLRFLQTRGRQVVERLVTPTTDVVRETDLERFRGRRRAAARGARVPTRRVRSA